MKCPYCAEEIKDEAILCRYCGQILSLRKYNELLRKKTSSLEEQDSEIIASLSTPPSGKQRSFDTAPSGATRISRDAIIFIPGIVQKADKTIREVSKSIATALDRQACITAVKHRPTEFKNVRYQERKTATMTSVVRQDESKETPVLDIYVMSYEDTLTSKYVDKTPILQALSASRLLISSFIYSVAALAKRRSGFSLSEKFNIIYGFGLALLIFIYILILLSTLFVLLGNLFMPIVLENTNNLTIKQIHSWFTYLLPYLQGAALLLVSGFFFGKTSLKQWISSLSINLMGAADYQKNKYNSRSDVTGQVSSLLEHIRKNGEHRKVHIFAYSFGSIIAIDALFPSGGGPNQEVRNIDALVTMGCPFDFTRITGSNYFEQRYAVAEVPRKWLNVYIPADLWATDFEDPQNQGKAPLIKRGEFQSEKRGIMLKTELKNIPEKRAPDENIRIGADVKFRDYFFGWFTLISLRLHASYWGDEKWHGQNSFDLLIPRILEGDWAFTRNAEEQRRVR